ncbi:hypothetical protein LguiB_028618 [Lonicera macranthoides]
MARPGERWSETLMRRAEERILVKIRTEQQRPSVAERDWVVYEREPQEMEEEEEQVSDEENEDEVGGANGHVDHEQDTSVPGMGYSTLLCGVVGVPSDNRDPLCNVGPTTTRPTEG